MTDTKQKTTPATKTCPHCKGRGHCDCELCAPSRDIPGTFREEFDTGRQEEETCYLCNGLGEVDERDEPLVETSPINELA